MLHPLHCVRRAVARLLAVVLFGHAAARWQGFAAAGAAVTADASGDGGADGSCEPGDSGDRDGRVIGARLLWSGRRALLLPAPLLARYRLPFPVMPLSVVDSDDSTTTTYSSDQAAAVPPGDPSCAAGGKLSAAAAQQRALVLQLVQQQALLEEAGGRADAARRLLLDCLPPSLAHVGARALSATACQLVAVDPTVLAASALARLSRARSHGAAAHALSELHSLMATEAGLVAVATAAAPPVAAANSMQRGDSAASGTGEALPASAVPCGAGWLAACERLLGAAPLSAEDQRLWLQLLLIVQRLVSSGPTMAEVCAEGEDASKHTHAHTHTHTHTQAHTHT